MRNGEISYWMQSRGLASGRRDGARAELNGDVDADVCIVGAGFTGLWAAYHLLLRDRALRIVILEREIAGYGASGRNAGWLSPLVPGNRRVFSRSAGSREAGVRLQRRMLEAVDEVLGIVERESIDAAAIRSGNVVVARNPAAMQRLRDRLAADRAWGYTVAEGAELSAAELAERIRVRGAVGGLFYPTVGRIDPGGLVRGLAALVERRGAVIHEHSEVTGIASGVARTASGSVRARVVLRCTEGYSVDLADDPRRIIPINSSIIITEPLPQQVWDEIGWNRRELFSDAAHVFSYSQRTDDGRILLGGRGNPYRFGSGTGGDGRVDRATVEALTSRLHAMFPATAAHGIAHAWSGVLGVTRDWCASVRFDPSSGLGHAQGYAGHGVTSAYLAAKTLAERVLGERDGDAALPWAGRQTRNWEPEPIRWAGVHAMYRMFAFADWDEERRGATRTSIFARLGSRLAGLHE
ncbi:NAD(P)/FAD-dependent oxidoreductase [Leucobacter massiliensis]|uniref:NAD(P)/FAD-dependent oxidoreductase n=1 Tax=Leucobacter massiliensis TaxID=1686285 RepID=UPI0015E29FD7|nr:FAD-dependent oxidoreductase [Leucobacter massiliensis]